MYKIKNWEKFQHFKNRKPPWIKLYRDILDNRCIMTLDSDKFRLLVCLWMIASENNGELPEIDDISWRLKISNEKALSDIRYLCDINLISRRYQDDTPERERETEKRREEKKETSKEKKIDVCVFDSFDSVESRMTDEYQTVLKIWQDERSKAGKANITDNQTKQGAAKLSQELRAGNVTEEDLRKAFKTALTEKEFEKYSLNGISNNLAKVLDFGTKTKAEVKSQIAGAKLNDVECYHATCPNCKIEWSSPRKGLGICKKCKKQIKFE